MRLQFFSFSTISFLVLISLLLSGCEQENIKEFAVADTIIINAKIYTVDDENPWAEAVAIKSGKYIYVGNSKGVEAYRGEQTKIVNLDGKMMMPGINDAHIHPLMGGEKSLFECNFPFSATPDQIADKIAQCVNKNSDSTWIIGGQWTSGFFENNNIPSPRKFLDAVSGDKAVLLSDDSTHNSWANSKALQLAGINKDTIDPSDGTFIRDPKTGEPNGIILEGADKLIRSHVPALTSAQALQAASEAVEIGNKFGITGMKDAGSYENALAAYQQLDQQNMLSMHMASSIRTPYGHREKLLDYERIDRIRDQYQSTNVHTSFVKIFMDGVPTSSHTAAMLAPYKLLHPEDEPTSGKLHITPELLIQDLIELDKRGYTVKLHAAGDRAVRVSLNAIEAAREANGMSGLQHEVAHAGYISEIDLPRFQKLQAVADLSPYLWFPSAINDAISSAIGSPLAAEYWPILSLTESGAHLVAGSDWPSVAPTVDPWVGIESMITRQHPLEERSGSLWPQQAINLEQTLKIFTINGAKALGLEKHTGSITIGKSADFIVLNHDLFEIEAKNISDTQVLLTFFAGEVVYAAGK